MFAVIVSLAFAQSACVNIPLERDPDSFGGNRYDAPEHIRGLHARGDSAGAPVRIRVSEKIEISIYVWELDTELDGVERYDRFAMSTSDDVIAHPEELIPLRPSVPEPIWPPAQPGAMVDIVIKSDRATLYLAACPRLPRRSSSRV